MKHALALLFWVGSACGGTRAVGTVAGRQFNANQAWGTISERELTLAIEENVNLCQAPKSGTQTNRYRLVAKLSEWNGTALVPATKAGIYTVVSRYCRDNTTGRLYSDCTVDAKASPTGALYALVEYQRDGEQAPLAALAGALNVTSLSAIPSGYADGTFSLFIDPQDKLTGSFASNICDLPN
jgi:hypothetical protein